jgi:hypothetical protein
MENTGKSKSNSDKEIMEETQVEYRKDLKKYVRKASLKCEMIWKIWKKDKSNSEMI